MKKRVFQILAVAILVTGGLVALTQRGHPEPAEESPPPIAEEVATQVEEPAPAAEPPKPRPVVLAVPKPAPKPVAAPKVSEAELRRRQWVRQSKIMAKQFDQSVARLAGETDPIRREKQIQQIARFVRFDTLETLDWVTTLNDAAEQHAALEAINKNALVGIGARIESDDQGFPRIKETTILSAIESTGQTQPGDVILGYVTPDGDTISFQGTPMREVARKLRGEAGTEVRLLMSRPAAGGGAEVQYDTVVQRSLIVIQPTY